MRRRSREQGTAAASATPGQDQQSSGRVRQSRRRARFGQAGAQHGPARRGGRQGRVGLPEAARGRAPRGRRCATMTGPVQDARQVAEHWFSDPAGMVKAQAACRRQFIDLWAESLRRFTAAPRHQSPKPRPPTSGSRPRMAGKPGLRLPAPGLSAHQRLGQRRSSRRPKRSTRRPRTRPGSTCARSERALALELPRHQSGTAARDLQAERREPRARHADARRGHRGRQGRAADPSERSDASSSSASTWRRRPARWCSATT